MTYSPNYYSGGPLVTATALAVDGSGSINVQVGATPVVSITCNQAVDALSMLFTVETKQGVDVATVTTGSITKSGTTASLSITSAMTTVERTLRWSMTNTATDESVADGLMFVTYDAEGD